MSLEFCDGVFIPQDQPTSSKESITFAGSVRFFIYDIHLLDFKGTVSWDFLVQGFCMKLFFWFLIFTRGNLVQKFIFDEIFVFEGFFSGVCDNAKQGLALSATLQNRFGAVSDIGE